MIKFVIIGLIVICLIVLLYFTGESEEHEPRISRNDRGIPIRLGEVTVDKLVLNPEFYQDHEEVTRFYTEQLDRTEAQVLETAEIEDHNDNIATLNVHFFHPINLEHKKKEVMEAPLKFMRRFNISVLILQEVPTSSLGEFTAFVERSGLHHTVDDFDYNFGETKAPITNMAISRYPIVVDRKIILQTAGITEKSV